MEGNGGLRNTYVMKVVATHGCVFEKWCKKNLKKELKSKSNSITFNN